MLTWDEETERRIAAPDKVVSTYNLVGTVSYQLLPLMSITTGLGKGFADDDNPSGSMKFSNGDLGTGVALGFSLPVFPPSSPWSMGLSLAWEYNISQKETSASADLTMGWSF